MGKRLIKKAEIVCDRCGRAVLRTGYRQKYCPACRKIMMREYHAKYYLSHKEQIREYQREYDYWRKVKQLHERRYS